MTKRTISEILMDILGSWPAFVVVLIGANGPALWDLWHHKPTDRLDLIVSNFTLQLDMVFLIGQNFVRKADRKLLKDIHKHINEIRRIVKTDKEKGAD